MSAQATHPASRPRLRAVPTVPFKSCPCGHAYTVAEWRSLERIGGVFDPERDYPALPGEELILPFELRLCGACGSTIARHVPYAGGSDYPPPLP